MHTYIEVPVEAAAAATLEVGAHCLVAHTHPGVHQLVAHTHRGVHSEAMGVPGYHTPLMLLDTDIKVMRSLHAVSPRETANFSRSVVEIRRWQSESIE